MSRHVDKMIKTFNGLPDIEKGLPEN